MPLKRLLRSFQNAFKGIMRCVLSERNMRIHLVAAAYVLFISIFFDLSRGEYAVLLLVIGSVIAAELFNTSIEILTDMNASHYNAASRYIKDIASGAVLVLALSSIGIAVCLFGHADGFVNMFKYFTDRMYRITLLLLSAVFSLLFIFVELSAVRCIFKRERGNNW